MINIRPFVKEDVPALQVGIDNDKIHPGTWEVKEFYDDPADENALKIIKQVEVIEDDKSPIAFVRYTKTLRICAVWADPEDRARNSRAVIRGIRNAIKTGRASGFTELIIQTDYEPLANFFTVVMKMTQHGDQYILAI